MRPKLGVCLATTATRVRKSPIDGIPRSLFRTAEDVGGRIVLAQSISSWLHANAARVELHDR